MDLDFWTKEWNLVTGAPVIYGAGLIAVGGVLWLVFDRIYRGEINALNARIGVIQERLRLADEKAIAADEKTERAKKEMEHTQALIQRDAPKEAIANSSSMSYTRFMESLMAQKDVFEWLQPEITPQLEAEYTEILNELLAEETKVSQACQSGVAYQNHLPVARRAEITALLDQADAKLRKLRLQGAHIQIQDFRDYVAGPVELITVYHRFRSLTQAMQREWDERKKRGRT